MYLSSFKFWILCFINFALVALTWMSFLFYFITLAAFRRNLGFHETSMRFYFPIGQFLQISAFTLLNLPFIKLSVFSSQNLLLRAWKRAWTLSPFSPITTAYNAINQNTLMHITLDCKTLVMIDNNNNYYCIWIIANNSLEFDGMLVKKQVLYLKLLCLKCSNKWHYIFVGIPLDLF